MTQDDNGTSFSALTRKYDCLVVALQEIRGLRPPAKRNGTDTLVGHGREARAALAHKRMRARVCNQFSQKSALVKFPMRRRRRVLSQRVKCDETAAALEKRGQRARGAAVAHETAPLRPRRGKDAGQRLWAARKKRGE